MEGGYWSSKYRLKLVWPEGQRATSTLRGGTSNVFPAIFEPTPGPSRCPTRCNPGQKPECSLVAGSYWETSESLVTWPCGRITSCLGFIKAAWVSNHGIEAGLMSSSGYR